MEPLPKIQHRYQKVINQPKEGGDLKVLNKGTRRRVYTKTDAWETALLLLWISTSFAAMLVMM
jgi:hypothetical protein